jgi:hypothetical protein
MERLPRKLELFQSVPGEVSDRPSTLDECEADRPAATQVAQNPPALKRSGCTTS